MYSYIKKLTVITLCSNTDSIQVLLLRQAGKMFNQLSRAVQNNLRWKGAEMMPSIAKKRLIWKKLKGHYLFSNQTLASTQIDGSAFLDRIRKVQNSKSESDLIRLFIALLIVMVL